MNQRGRLGIWVAAAFVLGAGSGGWAGGYAVGRSIALSMADMYYVRAMEAGITLRHLELMRAGRTIELIGELEQELDTLTVELASYEEAVNEDERHPDVYRVLRHVRGYRNDYPSQATDPRRMLLIDKALAISEAERG